MLFESLDVVSYSFSTGCGIKKQPPKKNWITHLLSISIARYSENCNKKFERGKKLRLSELESAILQLNKHKCRQMQAKFPTRVKVNKLQITYSIVSHSVQLTAMFEMSTICLYACIESLAKRQNWSVNRFLRQVSPYHPENVFQFCNGARLWCVALVKFKHRTPHVKIKRV